MSQPETVFVQNPFTKKNVLVTIPTIVFCGTEENCVIMLVFDKDPAKCGVFRGDLRKEPELRAELFNGSHPVVHWDEVEGKPETIN